MFFYIVVVVDVVHCKQKVVNSFFFLFEQHENVVWELGLHDIVFILSICEYIFLLNGKSLIVCGIIFTFICYIFFVDRLMISRLSVFKAMAHTCIFASKLCCFV